MFSRSFLRSPRPQTLRTAHVTVSHSLDFLSLRKPGMLLPQQGAHHEMFNMNNFSTFMRSLELQVAFSIKKNLHWKQLEKH